MKTKYKKAIKEEYIFCLRRGKYFQNDTDNMTAMNQIMYSYLLNKYIDNRYIKIVNILKEKALTN